MGAADFVIDEIQELLRNGIIQKLKSPYNNPIWVVDKKGTNESGKRKMRLVLNFCKLNERTVPDRYPMPNDIGEPLLSQTLHYARPKVRLP